MTSDTPACSEACYLCLGDGPDDSGKRLRRNCSCRGTAGFVHLSCLVEYAEHKTVQWNGDDPPDLTNPWTVCTHCKQDYQGQLALDLANEFVAFTQSRFPNDTAMHLEALTQLLYVLEGNTSKHSDEIKRIGHEMLFMIEQMKVDDPSLPRRIVGIEACVYNGLGLIYYDSDTEEGARKAMVYYEKCRVISQAHGFNDLLPTADTNLALARKKCGQGSQSEVVEKVRLLYEQIIQDNGEGSLRAIRIGKCLAADLEIAHQIVDATRLLRSLLATSIQVHGPSHRLTQGIETQLKRGKRRWVKVASLDEINYFEALRYNQDCSKLAVQGASETFDVAVKDVRFELGTPVNCHGLKGSLEHLNGKLGDLRSWSDESECFKVHFEDKDLGPHSIKQDFLRIVFELNDISEYFPRAESKSFVNFCAGFFVLICVALILEWVYIRSDDWLVGSCSN